MSGTVNIILKKGDITKCSGDVLINVLPHTLKLMEGGGVCKSILKYDGDSVQRQIDRGIGAAMPNILGIRLKTSAGSIKNINSIIHFVPSEMKVVAFQEDIHECFKFAQKCSFHSILIPAIGTANLGLSPRNSADMILNAAAKFSTTSSHHVTLTIVVYQEEMLPVFQKALEEKVRAVPLLLSHSNYTGMFKFLILS